MLGIKKTETPATATLSTPIIAGIVAGCILAIILVLAIIGVIYWRKRKKAKRGERLPPNPYGFSDIRVREKCSTNRANDRFAFFRVK
ncbi:MAG: hypothetical protein GY696_03500 [Gammaproteobacteria bacterium]|nr:hypothetical protein [Gammaproteobacteria bacterium]